MTTFSFAGFTTTPGVTQFVSSSSNAMTLSVGGTRYFEGAWVDYNLVDPANPGSPYVTLACPSITFSLNGVLSTQGPLHSSDVSFSISTFLWGQGKATTILTATKGLVDTHIVLDGDALPSIDSTATFNAWRASISNTTVLGSSAFPFDASLNLGVITLGSVDGLSAITENDLLIASSPPGDTDGVLMYAGAGDDTVTGSAYDDDIFGGNQNDSLKGLGGYDYLFGEAGNDTLFGGNSFDNLIGGTQNDALYGGNQADRIAGDDGNDRLFGGADADYLVGGNGRDQLNGDAGSDDLKGGAGADRFIFLAGMGRDSVRDFNAADLDTLQISRALAGGATATAASVIAGFASLTAIGARIDFGGGDVIILHGVTDLASVQAAITLF